MCICIYTYRYTYTYMHIISFVNQKGGVGKTTTCYNTGMELLRRGKTVLFIDLDQQGNLSYLLDASSDEHGGIWDVLTRKKRAADIIRESETAVLAASPLLASLDTDLVRLGKEKRLAEGIAPLRSEFDYALIDCPPSLGLASINALTASRYALICCQADLFSLSAVDAVCATIEEVNAYSNPELEIAGLLVCRYDRRTNISRAMWENLQSLASEIGTSIFETQIRECSAVKEALAHRKPFFMHDARSNAAYDYQAFTDELIRRVEGD